MSGPTEERSSSTLPRFNDDSQKRENQSHHHAERDEEGSRSLALKDCVKRHEHHNQDPDFSKRLTKQPLGALPIDHPLMMRRAFNSSSTTSGLETLWRAAVAADRSPAPPRWRAAPRRC